jgi:ubiquitin C-terminal hydrolase
MNCFDDALLPYPYGLENNGCVCYLNALLQSLISCTSFISSLKKIENKSDIVNDLINMRSSCSILSHMRKKFPQFGKSQESASEGLVLLLETIDNEDIYKKFNHIYEERIVCINCKTILSANREISIHFLLFDEDKLKTDGLDKYILEYYNTIKDYKGECKKCSNTSFTRCYLLKYIPEIVVCILNRYLKRSDILLPETFKVVGTNNININYKKIAEINHSGSLGGGHYVCDAVRKNNKVYNFNDTHVSVSSLGTKKETYITFYHLI